MSSFGNSYVNLAPPSAGGMPYDLQMLQLQRKQRMADLLRQQAAQPIDVQSGGGAPAPISWGSVLGKVLSGVGASMKEGRADQQMQQISQQDSDAAQALIKQLTQPVNQAGAPPVAPIATQLNPTAPQLPGQAAPQQRPAVPMQVGGAPGTAPTTAQPAMPDQLGAILAARGGPQTQMIQNAMLPQIMGRQNMDYQHHLGREDKQWEAQQPMPLAKTQEIAAEGAQAQANAAAANKLPQTAAQRATYSIEQQKLAEEHSYHQAMTGAGIGDNDPLVASFVQLVASGNGTYQSVPNRYKPAVAKALANAPQAIFSSLAGRRFALASQAITSPLMKLPQYELTAQGLPMIQRIGAAMTNPSSVGDQELLDSFTKLSTAGNAVTDAQVRIITSGKSLSDWAAVQLQRLKSGGVLSTDQRNQIRDIATKTYNAYKAGYDPLYKEATEKLEAAGIPKAFWTIPDLNKLNAPQTGGGTGAPSGASIAPAGTKATGPGGKVLTSDGKGGWN